MSGESRSEPGFRPKECGASGEKRIVVIRFSYGLFLLFEKFVCKFVYRTDCNQQVVNVIVGV